MPSNKNQIKAYIANDIYEKIKIIAKKENRSISNEIKYLTMKKIEDYENEHGEIRLDDMQQC